MVVSKAAATTDGGDGADEVAAVAGKLTFPPSLHFLSRGLVGWKLALCGRWIGVSRSAWHFFAWSFILIIS